ncbi:cobalamin biosynthesis protein [Gordonia paraffinivorans]|uniref:Cobalamin biosynthesis protein CobD n=2 Tax=Gordonia paraffinivorans TaxID=175628 RepID=A0ABQ0IND4_9ACTN|nr:cobalamin biosynthesis protein [Gordonia paraffinivorans]MBY4574022.1 cobalamin biosynthesis protein [Gordonia paraffinivorans]GAC84471.1 cobalamin biosynthesis protein CobD [Gordonia paraffinivorans NBRC 108238]VFA82989.1 cobalamin biosynthesis protein [Gordonia paraffinivorans]
MVTAIGLAAGYLLDEAFGDPSRGHPVAGFGRFAGFLEDRMYADSREAGARLVAVAVGSVVVGSATLTPPGSVGRAAATAAATWVALGGTSLCRVGDEVADALDAGDVDAARALVPSLCGRDPNSLDEDGIARAALESIAENTSDATVGPLFWGAVAGVPGVLAYRAVNTLDAMIGYRNERYRDFGWAAARLDDLANHLPARLAGAVIVAASGRPRRTLDAWRRDASAHPSPNAGVVEASFAGALGVQLGGRTVYPHGVEMRPALGRGPAPRPADLRAAVELSRRVQRTTAAVCVAGCLARAVLSRRSAG